MHTSSYLVAASAVTSYALAQSIEQTTSDGAKYIGCYTDLEDGARLLRDKQYQGLDSNDPDNCATFCAGYTYFGVEFGSECYCGFALQGSSGSLQADNSGCMQNTCPGDGDYDCGGGDFIAVYQSPNQGGGSCSSSTITITVTSTETDTITVSQSADTLTISPPAVTITQSAPGVTITQNAPGITITQSVPAITITQSAPGVTVTQSAPGITITQSSPGVTITQSVPAVTITQSATPSTLTITQAGSSTCPLGSTVKTTITPTPSTLTITPTCPLGSTLKTTVTVPTTITSAPTTLATATSKSPYSTITIVIPSIFTETIVYSTNYQLTLSNIPKGMGAGTTTLVTTTTAAVGCSSSKVTSVPVSTTKKS